MRPSSTMFLVAALLVSVAALAAPAAPAAPALPVITTPEYTDLGPLVTVPPFFEDRVIYYNSFDDAKGTPQINAAGLTQPGEVPTTGGGIIGRGLDCAKLQAFTLTGEAISPHKPITLSLWWCMTKDVPIDGGLGMLHLQGKGIVSNFVRGKGEWCGLQKPCAVFQVYYFPGIGNVNGLYDGSIWDRGALKAGVWHNTVLTISAGTSLSLYTDGQRVCQVHTVGRPFALEDGIRSAAFGCQTGMLVDEVMVLDRALASWEVAEYYEAIRQMRAVGYTGNAEG